MFPENLFSFDIVKRSEECMHFLDRWREARVDVWHSYAVRYVRCVYLSSNIFVISDTYLFSDSDCPKVLLSKVSWLVC